MQISLSVYFTASNAFDGCTGLTSVDFSATTALSSISNNAFYGCAGLTGSLTLPDSVTAIGGYAFYGCTDLRGALVVPDNTYYLYRQICIRILLWLYKYVHIYIHANA